MNNTNYLRPVALFVAMALSGCASEAVRNPVPGYIMGEGAALKPAVKGDVATARTDVADERRVDFYRGTGQLVKEPTPDKKPEGERKGEVELNFARVELQEVVQTVLGDLLHENFIIDPGVSGEVTLHTSRPVAKADLLPILEDLLRTHGAILVREQNGMYRVSPQQGYKGAGMVPELSKGNNLPNGFGVRIVPLKYIGAAEMQKILAPLAPESAFVRVDTIRNLLMLSGSRQQLANMMETIETFDVDWLRGMSVGFFELKYSNVEEVSNALSQVFGANDEGPMAGLVRVVPLERLRGLLLITPRAGLLDEGRKWIDRLDRQERGEGMQLFVYHVQNSKAAQLANMLGQLYGGESGGSSGTAPKAAGVAPGLTSAKTGSSGVGGITGGSKSTSKLSGGSTLGGGLSSGGLGSGSQRKSPFSPTTGTAAGTTGAGATGTTGTTGGQAAPAASSVAITTEITEGRDPVKIVANEENNSLVILATPEEYRKVEDALKRLDVQPMQVLVEATIIEVKLSESMKYGFQWWLKSKVNGFYANAQGNVADAVKGPLPESSAFNFALSENADSILRALLYADANDSNVRVLSSPSILVLDNHTAEIKVGDQIAIKGNDYYSSGTTSANVITSSYQYKDTGVLLEVTPRVNAGGYITLEIAQEVTDVVQESTSTSSSTAQPSFTQRTIKSTVAVQSGESVVLGGLIKGNNDRSEGGIPGLKDIPGVGLLFGATERSERRTELLVMLTPRAVRDQQQVRLAGDEVRDKMRAINDAYQRSQIPRERMLDPLNPSGAARPSAPKAAPADAEPRVVIEPTR